MKLGEYKLSLSIALLCHLIVILIFTKMLWPSVSETGWNNTKIIQSYLYQPQTHSANHVSHEKMHNLKLKRKMLKKGNTGTHVESPLTKIAKQNRSGLTKGDYNRLLIALHNHIEKNQSYPEGARLLGETGDVKVSFNLQVDGKLTNIRVVHSSGYQLLDDAAVAAIQRSSPFIRIKVKKMQGMSLMLSFRK